MREIIPASAGAEADVPLTCSTLPPTTTTKLCPAAEMSGKPLCSGRGSIVQSRQGRYMGLGGWLHVSLVTTGALQGSECLGVEVLGVEHVL